MISKRETMENKNLNEKNTGLNTDNYFCLGIDIGSIACKVVVLDQDQNIKEKIYERTAGRPAETLYEILQKVSYKVGDHIKEIYATGNSARSISRELDIPFVNELIAHAAAVSKLYPQVNSVIEMGGQDSKIIFLENDKKSEMDFKNVADFAMNGSCAAGTGSFLDQQAQRLEVSIEDEFGKLALQSQSPPRVAGRCSVFAKSDMIHLQQQATPVKDIIAGLCLGMARNIKSSLCQGKKLVTPVAFCGGVAGNQGLVWAIRKAFDYDENELIIPSEHKFTGAIGSCIVNSDKKKETQKFTDLEKYLEKLKTFKNRHVEITDRLDPLEKPSVPQPASKVHTDIVQKARDNNGTIDAYLGVDVGSISTNLVIMDKQKSVLSKVYLMTASKPIEAVKKGLKILQEEAGDIVNIKGASTTGSGRYLTGDVIGADLIINEITAQATGASLVDDTVDTIFEIGGQDSKYISLENGVVVDFEMNHACAAGTGSFLEEQAERLDLNIKEEFAQEAFKSEAPIHLGERCTVFIESDLIDYQQKDADEKDLVAGLAYSIVHNYLNRVIGPRKIGKNIFFQGGTAFNRAVVSAFENVTKKKITVPDHHEVTGALGAAELVRRKKMVNKTDSTFKGFDLSDLNYSIRTFECKHCSNHCEIKEVTLQGKEKLYYGSRCDRYNLKKNKDSHKEKDLFKLRNKYMLEYAELTFKSKGTKNKKIGLPLCLYNYQMLPLWSVFFKRLGFDVEFSGFTNKSVIENGTQAVLSQTCFPVKVAHGHILKLWEKDVDLIWFPSIVSMTREYPENSNNHLCPYVQTVCYQVRAALSSMGYDMKQIKERLIDIPVHMEYGEKDIYKSLKVLTDKLEVSKAEIRSALKAALKAQQNFEEKCKQKGKEILEKLPEDKKVAVVVSRPYNGCDPGINLDLSKKLLNTGMLSFPMDLLPLEEAEVTERQLQSRMYWKYGQKILRAAHLIRNDKRLFGVYISNFSCGPDSFIVSYFRELMKSKNKQDAVVQKPTLVLEIDEHSADAGVVTRIEAFYESLKSVKKVHDDKTSLSRNKEDSPWEKNLQIDSDKKLFIPWMGDRSYAVAAACRNAGHQTEVLPLANKESLQLGRKYTTGKECLPCIITTGDMLAKLNEEDTDPSKMAFFMPGTGGPCRFGQYGCLQKLILKEIGVEDKTPIFVPNQDRSLYRDFQTLKKDPSKMAFLGTIAVDNLYKMVLKVRPYEKNPGQTDRIYRHYLSQIIDHVEKGSGAKKFNQILKSAADTLDNIPVSQKNKPRIRIVGEVYVRNHVFANQNIVDKLENLGAEVQLTGLLSWMYYTNYTRKVNSKREKDYKALFQNFIRNIAQKHFEKDILSGVNHDFKGLSEDNVNELMEIAEPYVHRSFHGETILSVGEILHGYEHGISGAVNVGPFSCMPTNIVSSLTNRISEDCGGLPILNITYDGQNDPALTTRLEAFMYQVRAFNKTKNTAGMLNP